MLFVVPLKKIIWSRLYLGGTHWFLSSMLNTIAYTWKKCWNKSWKRNNATMVWSRFSVCGYCSFCTFGSSELSTQMHQQRQIVWVCRGHNGIKSCTLAPPSLHWQTISIYFECRHFALLRCLSGPRHLQICVLWKQTLLFTAEFAPTVSFRRLPLFTVCLVSYDVPQLSGGRIILSIWSLSYWTAGDADAHDTSNRIFLPLSVTQVFKPSWHFSWYQVCFFHRFSGNNLIPELCSLQWKPGQLTTNLTLTMTPWWPWRSSWSTGKTSSRRNVTLFTSSREYAS